MSFIEFKNICKKYAGNDKNSVTDFNLDIEEIWDYFVENYFKKTINLSLAKMVDYILNGEIDINLIKHNVIQ